jgi:hypothetical protein
MTKDAYPNYNLSGTEILVEHLSPWGTGVVRNFPASVRGDSRGGKFVVGTSMGSYSQREILHCHPYLYWLQNIKHKDTHVLCWLGSYNICLKPI